MTTAHHPTDVRHRQQLIAALRDLRIHLGMTQRDIADDLHLTSGAISNFERLGTAVSPRILTIQRYARALDRRLTLHIAGIPSDSTTDGLDRGDDKATADLLGQMVATRHRLGLLQSEVARRLGVTRSAVCDLETDPRDPRLATYQRYVRALGGRLVCRVVPAPVVDMVKVDLVHAGVERFGNLTNIEQVALFRRYAATGSPRGLQERWNVSGSRFLAVAALAEAA